MTSETSAMTDGKPQYDSSLKQIEYEGGQFTEVISLIRNRARFHLDTDLAAVDWTDMEVMLETPGAINLITALSADAESLQLDIERQLSEITMPRSADTAFVHFDLPRLASPFMKTVMQRVQAMCTSNATIIQSFGPSSTEKFKIIISLNYLKN